MAKRNRWYSQYSEEIKKDINNLIVKIFETHGATVTSESIDKIKDGIESSMDSPEMVAHIYSLLC